MPLHTRVFHPPAGPEICGARICRPKGGDFMRNKRLLILIAVMLIAVLTLSFVLVACKKKPDTTGGDTPSGDKPPKKQF